MASPYLTKPIRTVEQVMAERLRRPIPVGKRPMRASSDPGAAKPSLPQVVAKAAEGGGD